jgi:hypothetical protein
MPLGSGLAGTWYGDTTVPAGGFFTAAFGFLASRLPRFCPFATVLCPWFIRRVGVAAWPTHSPGRYPAKASSVGHEPTTVGIRTQAEHAQHRPAVTQLPFKPSGAQIAKNCSKSFTRTRDASHYSRCRHFEMATSPPTYKRHAPALYSGANPPNEQSEAACAWLFRDGQAQSRINAT